MARSATDRDSPMCMLVPERLYTKMVDITSPWSSKHLVHSKTTLNEGAVPLLSNPNAPHMDIHRVYRIYRTFLPHWGMHFPLVVRFPRPSRASIMDACVAHSRYFHALTLQYICCRIGRACAVAFARKGAAGVALLDVTAQDI